VSALIAGIRVTVPRPCTNTSEPELKNPSPVTVMLSLTASLSPVAAATRRQLGTREVPLSATVALPLEPGFDWKIGVAGSTPESS
jgi:hypothetical protein